MPTVMVPAIRGDFVRYEWHVASPGGERTGSAAAAKRILDLLGMKAAPDAFWEKLKLRHKDYSQWAQQNLIQLSEAEIWTGWILPEFPSWLVGPLAPELTLAWFEIKGQAVPGKAPVKPIE